MFAMGLNAHTSMHPGGGAVERDQVLGDDGLVSAAIVSPRITRSGTPTDDGRVTAAFVSPRQQKRPATTSGHPQVETPSNVEQQRPPPRLITPARRKHSESAVNLVAAGYPDQEGSFPRSESMPQIVGPGSMPQMETHNGSVFEHCSMGDSNSITSYPIPPVSDNTDVAANYLDRSGSIDAQLLPEEAELLRREVDAQRSMLQEHENRLRTQHGELVELTEQKRSLEDQMESTVKHVVAVMSEDKKRLNRRIAALEQEQAHVISSNQQLQGLVNSMGHDLQGFFLICIVHPFLEPFSVACMIVTIIIRSC
jgi:hypothetical protein